MKLPKSLSRTRKPSRPTLLFEKQNLSSFGGLVVFQALFADIGLSKRLSKCSPREGTGRDTSFSLLFRLLIANALLGMRKLRDLDHYREDPIVRRTLGVSHLPSIPTISRMLEKCADLSVSNLQEQSRDIVIEKLALEKLATVTLNFDSSVISTGRRAQGSAVAFNKNKKGARSDYPLFCTVAQSGQVLDAIIPKLENLKVRYAISAPFEQFHELKGMIEERRRWLSITGAQREQSAFEKKWKPKSGDSKVPFLFARTANPRAKELSLTSHAIARRRTKATYSGSIMAHNLCRELQMRIWGNLRGINEKRPALCCFREDPKPPQRRSLNSPGRKPDVDAKRESRRRATYEKLPRRPIRIYETPGATLPSSRNPLLRGDWRAVLDSPLRLFPTRRAWF